jgi:hypothetical protein
MADANELDRFADQLMRRVRDPAVARCDRLAKGEVRGPAGEYWRRNVSSGSIHELIPEIVDSVLFELLDAADNGELNLAWRNADGSCVALHDLGSQEMAGWLVGSGGWRERFSQQRFYDPAGDLELDLGDDSEPGDSP